MSDEEKERVNVYEDTGEAEEAEREARAKAIDHPRVNNMVKTPAAKQ